MWYTFGYVHPGIWVGESLEVQRVANHNLRLRRNLGDTWVPSLFENEESRCLPTLEAIQGQINVSFGQLPYKCHPILAAFVWELTIETISLPLGCLQGG